MSLRVGSIQLTLLTGTMALGSVVLVEPAPYDIMIALLSVSLVISGVSIPKKCWGPASFLWVFVVGNLLSMFLMRDVQRGLWFFGITAYLIMSWMYFVAVMTKFGSAAARAALVGYAVGATVVALLSIMAYFHVSSLPIALLKYGRVKGLFKDPNVFGPFLVPVAILGLLVLETARKSRRWWGLLIFGVTSLGIFLSFSRGAWVNYTAACVLYSLLDTVTSASISAALRKWLVRGLLILLMTTPVLLLFSADSVRSMAKHRLGFQPYDSQRFATQSAALEDALHQPVGLGPGQSEITYQRAAHSLYVRIFSENGPLGLLGFIGFLLVSLAKCLSPVLRRDPGRRFYAAVFALLAGIFLNSLVVDTMHWRHFWFLLALPWVPLDKEVIS